MGDLSFLDSGAPLRRDNTNNRQQQQQQQHAGTATNAGASAATAGAAGQQQHHQQQQQQPVRPRIQLPSFRQVQAAEAPTRLINTFQPGSSRIQQQQQQQQPPAGQPQQQQQQQQAPSWLQQTPPPTAGGGGGAASSHVLAATAAAPPQQPAAATAAAAAGAAAAGAPAPAASRQPSWMSGLPSMSLNTQLPRFSQGAGGGAATGAAVGISRPTVPPPQPSAAAGATGAGGAGSSQHQASGGSGVPAAQQQQVPINAVLVSRRQQGNPVLKHIRSVRWVFADIVPDYLCGQNTAVLFLSLRYHLLQPEYVLSRLQSLQRVYRLAVLLLLVDAEEVVKPLLELHRAALGAQAVLVCAWSNEECARYIETFKAYENRPASSIMEHTDTDYMGRLASALTTIRGVNRSDAYSLARHFGSLADVFKCNELQGFASIPGLGPVKAKRLLDTFNQPFRRGLTAANTTVDTSAAGAGSPAGASQQQQQGAAAAGTQGAASGQKQNPEGFELDEDLLAEYEEAAEEAAAAASGHHISTALATTGAAAGGAAADRVARQQDESVQGEGEDGEGGTNDEFDREGEELLEGAEDEGVLGGYHEDYLDPLDDGFDAEEF